MPKDSLEQFDAWLREAEAAPAELIEVGNLLFARGEPSDPAPHAPVSTLQTSESCACTAAWAGAYHSRAGGQDRRSEKALRSRRKD